MVKQLKVSTGKNRAVQIGKPYTPRAEGKTPKAKDINQMSSDEIREHLIALKYAQISLEGKRASGGALENPGQLRNNRKTIARMKTILIKRGERCV
jgi:large subunit ribosomal protein L29